MSKTLRKKSAMKEASSVEDFYNEEYYRRFRFGFSSETRSDHKRISELLSFEIGDSVLEIGCGFGMLLKKIPLRQKIGIELSEVPIKECQKQGLSIIKANVEEGIPFREGCFDIVIMNEVLEHFNTPKNVLRECVRILKTNGKILITTPIYHCFTRRIGGKSHFSEMTVKGAVDLIQKSGFKIITHEANGIFFLHPFLEYFLFKPFRFLQKIQSGINITLNRGHKLADSTFLKPLGWYRRKLLWLGLSQLILAQKSSYK
jgi:SAM-dependent methyltransferase